MDMLVFQCLLEVLCLEYLSDSLVCDMVGYFYIVDFEVLVGSDIFGGIGYIELNFNFNNLLVGFFINLMGYIFSLKLQLGDQVMFIYFINMLVDMFGDLFCVVIMVYDDEEEWLCCFVYEVCILFLFCDFCFLVSVDVILFGEN